MHEKIEKGDTFDINISNIVLIRNRIFEGVIYIKNNFKIKKKNKLFKIKNYIICNILFFYELLYILMYNEFIKEKNIL